MALTKQQMIAHIKQHEALFHAHQGYPRDVQEYFDEQYPEDRAIYWHLCGDLQIEPLQPLPKCFT